jgi:hypothetical protein
VLLGLVGTWVRATNQPAADAACTPCLTPLVPSCAPLVTSHVPFCTPLVTPLHSNGLGLGIGYCQYRRGRHEAERSRQSHQ